jgi:hypothetical protein
VTDDAARSVALSPAGPAVTRYCGPYSGYQLNSGRWGHLPSHSRLLMRWDTQTVLAGSFIHLVVWLTTGPKRLPKRALRIVRSRASSFKWEYPLLSLRSSNCFVRLILCLPVTSIPHCILPSVTRCRRQFLRKMWPIRWWVEIMKFLVMHFSAPPWHLFPLRFKYFQQSKRKIK